MLKRLLTIFVTLFGAITLVVASVSPVSASEAGDIIIQIDPSEQNIELTPGEPYHGTLRVDNIGSLPFNFTVSVRPYYVSGEDYDPDFYIQNDFTKLSNWIKFEQTDFYVEVGNSQEVNFTVDVPIDAPGGSQYAAILVETRDAVNPKATVSTVAQLASLIYAHVAGDDRLSGEIISQSLPSFLMGSPFTARVAVENDGNVDFRFTHTLTIRNFFTNQEVFSPDAMSSDGTSLGRATPIILPATTRANALTWAGAPQLGIFRAVQTVSFLDQTYTYERVVFLCPIWLAILAAFFVVLMILWIILRVIHRKRNRPQSF